MYSAPTMYSAAPPSPMAVRSMQTFPTSPVATVMSMPQTVTTMHSYASVPAQHQVQYMMAPTAPRGLHQGEHVATYERTHMDLVSTGHLIEDPEREHYLLQQGMAIPGALPGPNTVYTSSATQFHSATTTTIGTAVVETETLEVSILQATNLTHMNMTGDNLWASCEVVKTGRHQKASKCETQAIKGDLNPVWNEMHHLDGYVPGEPLLFIIHDHGMIGSKTEGKVQLEAQDFYPNGFEGELQIDAKHDARIVVRVVPLGPTQPPQ